MCLSICLQDTTYKKYEELLMFSHLLKHVRILYIKVPWLCVKTCLDISHREFNFTSRKYSFEKSFISSHLLGAGFFLTNLYIDVPNESSLNEL